ncbi:hypothetical protein A2V80_03770 [Candidatus Woesebacteria bacterium RBG_16_39_8b]|uniref:Uncharacterized protein n=1 Tax=Candidatus Woesebacteria bacterium RBG_16_39_8b TaxID=1802482 RepID=A0A1F7XA48_9BACT|nr:MAG: hypothetical protein A2V80_03770 [Candidatus Woesebacteria bacterium RBG_16_39_8b]
MSEQDLNIPDKEIELKESQLSLAQRDLYSKFLHDIRFPEGIKPEKPVRINNVEKLSALRVVEGMTDDEVREKLAEREKLKVEKDRILKESPKDEQHPWWTTVGDDPELSDEEKTQRRLIIEEQKRDNSSDI